MPAPSTRVVRGAVLLVAFLACLEVVATPSNAMAQDNSAAVEGLFNEGKRLAREGKIAAACPKFLASYNLERRLGTLLNLADCYEKNGQLASAWARFVEARTMAQRANQADRADFASQHATALEPRLSKLTIVVKSATAGFEVKRNGVTLDPGAYGVAVAVDAGRYTVQASAPSKSSWTGEVVVSGDADRKTMEIPALADLPASQRPILPMHEETRAGSWRGPAGLVIAGIGVVSLGVGAGFGLSALDKNSDSKRYCGANGGPADDCFGEGIPLRQDAVRAGNISTIFLSAGTVAVVGGVILWLTAPSSSKPSSASTSYAGMVF